MRFIDDHLFATLTAVGASLLVFGVFDLAWRRWRESHPRRRPPSRKDWRRIRAVEERLRAAHVIARVRAEAASAEVEAEAPARRESPSRRRAAQYSAPPIPSSRTVAVDSTQIRLSTPVPAVPAGWVHAFSGSLT
ncbi:MULTISPECIES: hypothetical protein [Actinoalloteichus]|uniref:Uncharacterized protein n=1 Tax=Actinoalloteichus fjordicus TaxID=1612552 RepID=A0AAC9L8K1_9PSEU|nr:MULTISPECIES: hypothetical protein [Actinoalloteichus]APU13383.1 hypothetical protein UA74_06550 [Actinoalloteichus fjordicus]APU19333.1 hypothetical protein UA75_06550 [Actinoalloteichus sp. GBA129-24]